MLKLYKIEVKGIRNGNLATNCSPGITYVVAPTMDTAHVALMNIYKKEIENGNISLSDIQIDTLTIVASEDSPCFSSNEYKLIDYRNNIIEDENNDINLEDNDNE